MRPMPALLLLLIAAPVLADATGEDVFEAANHWTVQVRTAVDRPFIEDDQGSSTGAGLVIDAARGWLLTNAHVASHSFSEISIVFRGQRPLPAQRLYVDPYLDLAVLAYDPHSLPAPPQPELECRGIPAVGHPVGAFGHPWGFRFTGTRGIASAVTSRLGPAMLQTDAPINHGNSGGPLVSMETGRVVGINTAIWDKKVAEGLSFAVPMPYACTIVALLREGRDPSPPAHLVDFAVNEDGEQTLLIARSRLPDESIDLRPGDVLLAIESGDRQLNSETDLVDALRGRLGDVALRIERNGATVVIRGQWPAAAKVTERQGVWISGALFAYADDFTGGHLTGDGGLMVHHVEPGSAAEIADLYGGDLLVSAGGQPVKTLAELRAAAERAAKEERDLSLMLLRIASGEMDKLFIYQTRALDAGDIAMVGPERNPAALARR